MSTIGERIRKARNDAKLTQPQLADRAGVSKGSVSMWETGVTQPNGENLLKLAEALSLTPDYIIGGQIELQNTSELKSKPDLVPLISWVQAGAFCESPDLFNPGDAEEWMPCPSRHSNGTFALRVKNDSMTSLSPGERSYPHGTIIFVDPERAHTVGSRVVARLPGSSESTFKVYTEDAGQPYLMPINPKYPSLPVPEGTLICGVVIGSYLPE